MGVKTIYKNIGVWVHRIIHKGGGLYNVTVFNERPQAAFS